MVWWRATQVWIRAAYLRVQLGLNLLADDAAVQALASTSAIWHKGLLDLPADRHGNWQA